MKKFLPAFLAYSVFAVLVVFAASFFTIKVPIVEPGFEGAYKAAGAFKNVFDFLPSILLTGFLLASSIAFSANAQKARNRFSPHMAGLFKQIIIASLATAFAASIGTLVLLPYENSKMQTMQEIPRLLAEYENTASIYRLNKNPGAAKQYVKQALALNPNSQALKELDQIIEIEQKEQESIERARQNKSYIETDFNSHSRSLFFVDEKDMTSAQMTKLARERFAAKDFFEAHYLSIQAGRLCQAGDPIALEAKEIAEAAWERLEQAQKEELSAGNIFFRNKMRGYSALVSGDFEEAYYIFHDLSQEDARKARDPDVNRYLAEAQKELLEKYFFVEETYDANRFESAKNVCFSARYPNGKTKIVLIRGVTDVEGTGGIIKYLRGFSIYSFDKNGKFESSLFTPYAKMKEFAADKLDQADAEELSLSADVKYVPYIMLRSVSKSSRAVKNEPVYNFENQEDGGGQKKNQIFLPIPYQDFSLILLSSAGKGNLNPFSLNRLARKAPNYGYSSEAFSEESLNRIFYPFMLLIILIFVATIAWNYRLSDGAIFKFKWIFILPSLNAVFYFAENSIEYLIKILNLVFIAMAGTYMALFAGIAVYVLLLVAVSVVFLSRKSD